MDYESIKRLGLDHYNIDLEKSFETFDPSNNNHTIVLYLKKDKTISCPYCFIFFGNDENGFYLNTHSSNNLNPNIWLSSQLPIT